MAKRAAVALGLLLFANLGAQAQTAPRPPGPGDPLPEVNLIWKDSLHYRGGRIDIYGDWVLTMGDVRVTGDHLTALPGYRHFEATGNVVLTRGDERLTGSRLVVDVDQATFTADDSTLISPPLYLRAKQMVHTADGTNARDAQLATGTTDGRGELQMHAENAFLSPDQNLHLRNAVVSLYDRPLFTIKRLTIKLAQRRNVENGNSFTPPFIVRDSSLSGAVVGFNLPYALYHNLSGRAIVEETTQQGIEYLISLNHTLYSRGGPPARKRYAIGEQAPPAGAEPVDPPREMLKARPVPPPPDPILDYTSITTTADPLANPTRSAGANLSTTLNIARNQEIGSQRQGPLLVSRQPEVILNGQLPLNEVRIPEESNADARSALHIPRLALIGSAEVGQYDEQRLFGARDSVRYDRLGLTAGIETLPILIQSHILVQAQSILHDYHYQTGNTYLYLENSVNGDYVFAERTAIGISYINRALSGATPFYFDQVDTQDEGQVRAETEIGSNHRYVLAALGRYDLDQHQFFDFEFAVGIHGHNVEPRLTYHHLGRQFGIAFALPGLTSP